MFQRLRCTLPSPKAVPGPSDRHRICLWKYLRVILDGLLSLYRVKNEYGRNTSFVKWAFQRKRIEAAGFLRWGVIFSTPTIKDKPSPLHRYQHCGSGFWQIRSCVLGPLGQITPNQKGMSERKPGRPERLEAVVRCRVPSRSAEFHIWSLDELPLPALYPCGVQFQKPKFLRLRRREHRERRPPTLRTNQNKSGIAIRPAPIAME